MGLRAGAVPGLIRRRSVTAKAAGIQEEGYQAHKAGVARADCPHAAHRTYYRSHWLKGWDRAAAEAQ